MVKKMYSISLFSLLVISILTFSCTVNNRYVSIMNWNVLDKETGYWQVVLDMRKADSRYDLGVMYGKAVKRQKKDYAKIIDSYLAQLPLNRMLSIMALIRDQVPKAYQDEIEGFASVICKTRASRQGDGILSLEELYAFELITDTWRATACSGLGVWGSLSIDGKVRAIRVLDYFAGRNEEINTLNAVTIIRDRNKYVCLVGYLGMFSMITGFNQSGVFAGILDSTTGATFDPTHANSYSMDLRYALESFDNAQAVAEYMIDPSRKYAYNHNILLADRIGCMVVENNISGSNDPRRMIRTEETELAPGVAWPFPDSICVVNSFVSRNQSNNHENASNSERWKSFLKEVNKYKHIGKEELESIAGYYSGTSPGKHIDGDIYCNYEYSKTLQILYFEPETNSLEAAFLPKSGIQPLVPRFWAIPINILAE